ncbi:hypothetical protein [uncultured Stenotrophomonas sp.]|uniref:hypothetical protein n=1 Tax=uncultured Stenotrophomonas sp. TaxID=165438 RepID=UPI0028EECD17|nr:hypothetical protein [uncultured Stenotrophomonas sp.]
MTTSKRVLPWAVLATWMVLPGILLALAHVLDHLYPFLAHQLYYLPLGSWVGLPYFEPDSEVMFWVNPAGRFLTAESYLALAALITFMLDRMGVWRNTMWRHIAALLVFLALTTEATTLFNIGMRAGTTFSFERADAIAVLCSLWFALAGGWISGRYGFAVAVALINMCMVLLSAYFVVRHSELGYLQIVAANTATIAIWMGAGALGASAGVFIRNLGSGAARQLAKA